MEFDAFREIVCAENVQVYLAENQWQVLTVLAQSRGRREQGYRKWWQERGIEEMVAGNYWDTDTGHRSLVVSKWDTVISVSREVWDTTAP